MAITINLGLQNSILYEGCKIEEVGGRLTLTTPPDKAGNIIGKNCQRMVEALPSNERDEVVLTGPMAVWSYLVIFHQVVHRFGKVYYDDGRGNRVLVAQH